MEHELFISGIGGQGVQLVGRVLALAATAEGLYVQLTGEYGGSMRGGSTVAAIVVGAERLHALPVVPEAGSAIALHRKFWEDVAPKLRPGSLLVADPDTAANLPDAAKHRLIEVRGSAIAAELGNPQSAGLVMLGAYNAITGLVPVDSLVAAMKEVVPSYRRQHVEANERAIRAGDAAAPRGAARLDLGRKAA